MYVSDNPLPETAAVTINTSGILGRRSISERPTDQSAAATPAVVARVTT
jgi:ABC-type transporter Mla subunit MlaD